MKDPFYKRESEKYDSPIASRELILSYLTELEKPANLDNIAKAMNINNEQQKEALHRRLRAMERDGQLIFTRRKCYALPEKCAMLKGNVIGHRDGFGFLRVDGVADDYFLAPEQMRKTLHGDVVLAQPMSHQYKGKIEARVVRILEHRNPLIVGRYFIEEGIGFVVPDDGRLNFDILITEQQEQTIRMGAVVVVELLKRPEYRKKAIGKITEVLGENMGTNLAIDIALRNHDIPHSFPKIVDQSASKFNEIVPESAKKGRKDLTDLPLIIIDGEDARDFDDAVYCKKNRGGGYRLWVAIADVSYYVRPKTDLDIEAYNRSTSVYFPSRVVPMLPEVLSNGLCSLNPQVDRLCLVCEMTISLNGRLTGYEFYEAVMNSHARLTYNKVQKILDGDEELREQYKPRIKDIKNLHGLYQILDKTRIERGAIAFESAEPKFIFNADKRIERVEIAVRNDAHKIIEECMILANVAAAKFVEKNQLPCLYRVHDKPNKDRLINLKTTINELGLRLQFSDEPTSKDIAKLMEQVAKRPDHEMLQTMILRSMKQAIYDAENRGHFGLALESYAHFTSPIRRYPDLLLHRTIKWILDNQQKQPSKTGGNRYEMNEMLMFGEHCSNNERRADEAVRDVVDWLKCDFMQDHVGESFDGTISTVTNFGFFVRLNDLFIDGLVHVATLENDYYQFDAERNRLIGESGRISYRLGDKVNITVLAVNPEDRKMDFILTGSSQKRSKPKPQRKKSSTSNRMKKNPIESADKELKSSKKKSGKGNQSSKRKGKVKDKSSEESISKEKTKKKQRTKKPKSQIKVNKEPTTALNQRKKSSKK